MSTDNAVFDVETPATTVTDAAAARHGDRSFSWEEISFRSRGQRCDGRLYRPHGPGPHPCLLMAHGLGGIRSAVLPDIAERFARAGSAALVFDYRHLGASEGAPRGLIDITKQRDDYRAALDYVGGIDGIDAHRLALWGTSFSGGHVLAVAAVDDRVAAAVIQNPFVDGRAAVAATIRSAGLGATARLVWKGLRDQACRVVGREPHRVELAGTPGTVAMITTADAVAGYESIMPAEPIGWEPAVPARIVLRLGLDRPAQRADRITCPLLVCVCDDDRIAPARPAVRVAERAIRGELRRYPIGHFDVFTDPWFEPVVADQVAFLRATLLSSGSES